MEEWKRNRILLFVTTAIVCTIVGAVVGQFI